MSMRILYNLKTIPAFKGIPTKELLMALPYMTRATFLKDQEIFSDNDSNTPIYFIIKGKVKLQYEDESGKPVEKIIESGQIFGEMAFVLGQPFKATATAVEPTRVLKIQRKDLDYILQNADKINASLQ